MNTFASTLRNLLAAASLLGLATLAAQAATDAPAAPAAAPLNGTGLEQIVAPDALRAEPQDGTDRPMPECWPRRC